MQNNYDSTETIHLRNSDRDIILKIEKSEISKLNKIIKNFLIINYKKYGFVYGENKQIEIDNVLIQTEYLSKFVNNKTLFGKIAEKYKLKTVEELTSYITNHLSRLYDFDGADFIDNYELTKKTTEKGKRGEKACKENFEKMLFEKHKKIFKIESPEDITEDINGIDGKFNYNGNEITIQIKPYTRAIEKEGKIFIYSRGSMCFNTNYLLLYKESWKYNKYYYDFITLKNGDKHDQFDKIKYNNGIYEADKKYIVKKE